MISASIAAPVRAVQPHGSQPENAGGDRLTTLKALPQKWQQALLSIGRHKQPIDATGRCLTAWLSSPVPPMAQLLQAPAVGLRTGQISQTLCIDIDGAGAMATFQELFKGKPREVLPRSIAWTSGKPKRCQIAYHIPASAAALLQGKRRKIGDLELRWEGAQSVLLGHHPETGSYRWVRGCAPWEVELATFPLELLALVPDVHARPRQTQVIGRVTPHVAGLVVPLEQFVTLRSRLLIANGSAAGHCNADAIGLSMDLVAAEVWLKAQGVGVERSAQALFDDYCRQCPDTINGKPFDWRAMQARFDGAMVREATPPTPETKLLERLDYHRRAANRTDRTQRHPLEAGANRGQEVAA